MSWKKVCLKHKIVFLWSILIAFTATSAQAVLVDGKDWRQLTETTNITWSELDAIYDTNTGLLDTAVTTAGPNSVNFDGWVWASNDEVTEMFNVITGFNFTTGTTYNEAGSTWGPKFLQTFDSNHTTNTHMWAAGYTRELHQDNNGCIAGVIDVFDISGIDIIVYSSGSAGINDRHDDMSVWVYKKAAPVPVPSTIVLFSFGILGLVELRRRSC